MTRDWEAVFSSWAQGPSKTEQEKAENAERQVYSAIQTSTALQNRNIRVFTQGSYRNRVNVRQESDVDIRVLCFDTYFPDYSDDNVKAQVSKREIPATYTYAEFKNELQDALFARFGAQHVTRGDKAFQIDENTYRVKADVAAFFEHRRYYSPTNYHSGVQMRTDKGRSIINWPEQHYDGGVSKNTATSRRYKRGVRILKTLRNEMAQTGVAAAEPIPSFLVECLVCNAPNTAFNYSAYQNMIRAILANLFNDTQTDQPCSKWGEVSELKILFHPQPALDTPAGTRLPERRVGLCGVQIMLTRIHIASFIGLTIVTWLVALWLQGQPVLSLAFLRPFGVVVGMIVVIVGVFSRWAWAWPLFRGWYVKRPDIRGTWKVVLQSNWTNPETGKVTPPITAFVAIRQTLTTLSLRLMTPESKSKLIAHSIEFEEDGIYRIAGIYRNEPRVELQGDRSEIHHGSLLLEVYGTPPTSMEGHYWTDRGTRGTMKVAERKGKIFDNFEAANAGFA